MDNSQLLKGILEGCVLGIIEQGETYGYEILGELEKAGFEGLGEGTVYPLITRLDKNKLISCRRAKSPLGPIRKYYTITDEGKKQLEDFKRRYAEISESANRLLYAENKGNKDKNGGEAL